MRSLLRRLLCLALLLCFAFSALPARAGETEKAGLVSLQERLLALGYEIGKADGLMGPKTSSALLLAQTLLAGAGFSVSPTGKADAETLRQVLNPENEALLRTLLKGSWGSRVKAAQRQLISLNLLWDSADGSYGANTEAAVAAFEAMMAQHAPETVRADGRLSPAEYSLLLGDLSIYGITAPLYFDDEHPENLSEAWLYAKSACLIDAVTGEVLLEKAADEPTAPASTTKIVTLLTALSLCDPDASVVIPAEAADVPADSTLVPVTPGETMVMRDLLYAMMIRSGNDAASAVAVLCSGSADAFAEEMNRTAAALGMENSHFVNAHGYTADGHYTTARDLAIAARYGMTLPLFSRIVTCLKYTLPPTEKRDALVITLDKEIFNPASPFYIPHAAGIKSGYTSAAGYCYVGAYQENGATLIAAVMGERWRDMTWTDLKRLFAYGMAVREQAEE